MADEPVCLNCVAQEISSDVLIEFTNDCPDVRMSYSEWMSLGIIIEEQIKTHLGTGDSEETSEEHTVQ